MYSVKFTDVTAPGTGSARRTTKQRGCSAEGAIALIHHGMFCQWDMDYTCCSAKIRPVCRAVGRRSIGVYCAESHRLGFKPLPAGFVAAARMGLVELAEKVKG